ncbi:MAG: hypothetical protein EA400_11615 [Chromatiaceae bacterium]|nr:MAG: hypothetical protein EA400_11615 [Chromatiaceae bacterium]
MSKPASDPRAIETKLASARTRLILDKPFLGALVLRLPLQPASPHWCRTTATDARTFYYNPEYIAALSLEETQFMLAHEALHCALSHFARRQHRVKHRWDLACDYAINPLLIDDGLTAPPNALVMPLYRGLTAEEIYPLIDDNDRSETLDTHAYDRDDQGQGQGRGQRHGGMDERDLQQRQQAERGDRPAPESQTAQASDRGQGGQPDPAPPSDAGPGDQPQAPPDTGPTNDAGMPPASATDPLVAQPPPPLTPGEQETLAVLWKQRLAGAAQQALQAGKLGGGLKRIIDHLLQPQLPWRMLLARYLSAVAREDYSWTRPSRREGDYLMPSLRSQQLDVIVALDTSGSIRDEEMQAFIDEVDALKGQVRARLTLLPCDASLCPGAPFRFEPWEQFCRPRQLSGGGGTSFQPVFQWVAAQGQRPDLLIYFTDANGSFPNHEPDYPVVWLVKGSSPVPWGQRIQLN